MIDVDNSTLVPVAECSTKALLNYHGFAGKGEKDAMDVGNVIHAGLEAHYTGASYDECMALFDKTYDQYFPPDVRVPNEDRFYKGNVRDHFDIYISRNHPNSKPFEVLEAEKMVGIQFTKDVRFWIKRDLLVKSKQTGFRMPLDHKTTGRITKYWQDGWKLSSQMAGYIWLTQKETGEPNNNIYINAMEINKLPSSRSRCAIHKVPYSTCRLEHTKSSLLLYDYSADVIAGWRSSAIMLASRLSRLITAYPPLDMIQLAPMEGMFNQSCKFCGFSSFCRAGRYEHIIPTFLVENIWEPWKTDDSRFIG